MTNATVGARPFAQYLNGSGTPRLLFRYVVGPRDGTGGAPLNYAGARALEAPVAGVRLDDAAGAGEADARLAPAATSALALNFSSNVIIDAVATPVVAAAAGYAPPAAGDAPCGIRPLVLGYPLEFFKILVPLSNRTRFRRISWDRPVWRLPIVPRRPERESL